MVQEPVLRDLSAWPRASGAQVEDRIWEISAPQSNSLSWSLILSYLIPSANLGNFARSLELIIGDSNGCSSKSAKLSKSDLDFKTIEKRVKNVNPFKNAHTLFFDNNLIKIMRHFKVRLNQLADKLKREEGGTYDDNLQIQAASNAFECQIDLYGDESNIKTFRSFSPAGSSRNSELLKIVIFKRQGSQAEKALYGMGIEENYSQDLRHQALKHILKTAKVPFDQISVILNLVPSDRFLRRLLESSASVAVPKLFESPYFLKKLSDAGYDVSPLSVGPDGLSSFYPCIIANDWKLFFILYNSAVKSIQLEEENVVNHNQEVLLILKAIRDTLMKDCEISQNFSFHLSKKPEALHMYDQVIRFNKYEYEIREKVMSIKDDSSIQSDEKSNNIMMALVDKYNEYFCFDFQKQNDQLNQFTDYVHHFDYHKNVDDLTCSCFFENFLSLKAQIDKDHEYIFSDALTSLFMYMISTRIFRKIQCSSSSDEYSPDEETTLFIPFCYRMKFKHSLLALSSELKRVSSGGNKMPMNIVESCLKNNPMIKEEFQITRLKIYLRTGERVSFDSSPIKAALVIERTLQAIGETLCRIGDDCVVIPLLKYCLPPGLEKELCDLRNHCLSHFRASSAQGRKRSEQGRSLEEIQKELNQMTGIFESIFTLQTLRVKENMIKFGIQESQDFSDDIHEKLKEMKTEVLRIKRNFYRKHEMVYISVADKILRSLKESLRNGEIEDVKMLKSRYLCLKFLLSFIAEFCDRSGSDTFGNELKKLNLLFTKENTQNICQQLIIQILKIFSKLQNDIEGIFGNIQNHLDEKNFPHLSTLFKTIKKHEFFTPEEKEMIRNSLEEALKKPSDAKQQLINHVSNKSILSPYQINKCFEEIFASEKIKKEVRGSLENPNKALEFLKSIEDTVDQVLGTDEDTCYNFIRILGEDKYRDIVPKLRLSRYLHDKIIDLSNQKLDFVKDRMNLLELILISENEHISKLRKYGTSKECRRHTKRLMRQRYMEEMDSRAALEMLLFDCLGIFNKKMGLKDLWLKTSNLFTGINLRDILSHGSPVFETANDYLDQENLPAEFINKILTLIDDQIALTALIELWKKMNYPNRKLLQSVIKSNSQDNYSGLRERILKCEDRWESYLLLLPIK